MRSFDENAYKFEEVDFLKKISKCLINQLSWYFVNIHSRYEEFEFNQQIRAKFFIQELLLKYTHQASLYIPACMHSYRETQPEAYISLRNALNSEWSEDDTTVTAHQLFTGYLVIFIYNKWFDQDPVLTEYCGFISQYTTANMN